MHKTVYEEMHILKLVCLSVPHKLTKHQKAKHSKIYKDTLKLLNDDRRCIISKVVTGDETYIPIFDVRKRRENF